MSEQLPNALVGRIQNIPLTEDLQARLLNGESGICMSVHNSKHIN